MATTATPYGQFYTDLGNAVHNFGVDTDKIALVTSSYTPAVATDTTFANIAAYEIAVTGNYATRGQALTTVTWTYSSGTQTTTLNAATASWTNLATTFRYAVIYKDTGTNTTSKLIQLIDFGADRQYFTENVQISWPSGILSITLGP